MIGVAESLNRTMPRSTGQQTRTTTKVLHISCYEDAGLMMKKDPKKLTSHKGLSACEVVPGVAFINPSKVTQNFDIETTRPLE